MKPNVGWSAAAAACVCAGLLRGSIACSGAVTAADEAGVIGDTSPSSATPAAPVMSDRIRRGALRQLLLLEGSLRAVVGVQVIVPKTSSREVTIRWLAEDGAAVRQGDRLVELDTSVIASQLDDKLTARLQAINELAAKRAEVLGEAEVKSFAAARARVALEKAKLAASVPVEISSRKLFKDAQLQQVQAQTQYDKAMADAGSYEHASDSELEVLRIDVATAEREVAEAERAIETMALRATRDGIAVVGQNRREDRKFQVGDVAWVGAEVMEIPDLSEMMVEARLSDVDDGKIVPGMRVVATLDAYPASPVGGAIRSISPVAHEAGRRSLQRHFRVMIDLDESNPEIMRPGMSVKIEVESVDIDDALLVPRSALMFGDVDAEIASDAVEVLLADGSRAAVRIGACGAFDCVLLEGPAAGTATRSRR